MKVLYPHTHGLGVKYAIEPAKLEAKAKSVYKQQHGRAGGEDTGRQETLERLDKQRAGWIMDG
jgi:hypothetical protein